MSTPLTRKFDTWIRNDFKAINTQLEELYFQQPQRDVVDGFGHELKMDLLEGGSQYVKLLLQEGNTDEGFDNGFDLLGNVGFFMAACRRHEMQSEQCEAKLRDASALAMQLGASLGVAPRFASAHLETHNYAVNGHYKTFTTLADEKLFLDYNTRGVFAFIRASEALRHILPLGISHPVTADLLKAAKLALEDVYISNGILFDTLDIKRFFFNVRPYYKTHKVGRHEYRGANAGDFAGINVIDLLLGVCRADDPYYSQVLVDKFLFMRPDEQLILRDCMRRESLLNQFLRVSNKEQQSPWYQENLKLFLAVCEAHGKTASQHHEQLVNKFIEKPADDFNLTEKPDMAASGPPLPVLLKALKTLHDLRTVAKRDDIPSRYQDFETLRISLSAKP